MITRKVKHITAGLRTSGPRQRTFSSHSHLGRNCVRKSRFLPLIPEVKPPISYYCFVSQTDPPRNQVAHDTHLITNSGVDEAWLMEGHKLAVVRNGGNSPRKARDSEIVLTHHSRKANTTASSCFGTASVCNNPVGCAGSFLPWYVCSLNQQSP